MDFTARQKVYKSYVRDYVQGKPHTSCICVGLSLRTKRRGFLTAYRSQTVFTES